MFPVYCMLCSMIRATLLAFVAALRCRRRIYVTVVDSSGGYLRGMHINWGIPLRGLQFEGVISAG